MPGFWHDGSRGRERLEAALILAALIWAGMLIGVSFLATPAKFGAPSLTLPVALDVGRHIFAVFMPIEVGMAVIVTGLAVVSHRRAAFLQMALVDGIVSLQAVWLLPALDSRVAIILAGGTVPDSPLHLLYIGLDAAKLLALMMIGVLPLFRRGVDGRQARSIERRTSL